MNRKITVLVVIAMLALPFAMMAQTTNPTTVAPALTVPISGTTDGGGKVTGTFQIQKFVLDQANNRVNAVGNLVAEVTRHGSTQTVVAIGTAIPVLTPAAAAGTSGAAAPNAAAAVCNILNLTLGPLDLNLLGLQVHLNQVVLNITAQPGAGNLLGNLLCDIANLLNPGGALSTLVADLNQLLGILGNLGL
jgi:hypothetical protein